MKNETKPHRITAPLWRKSETTSHPLTEHPTTAKECWHPPLPRTSDFPSPIAARVPWIGAVDQTLLWSAIAIDLSAANWAQRRAMPSPCRLLLYKSFHYNKVDQHMEFQMGLNPIFFLFYEGRHAYKWLGKGKLVFTWQVNRAGCSVRVHPPK